MTAPGEVITDEVCDYLRSGVQHGVLIPDAADASVETLRVLARRWGPQVRRPPAWLPVRP